MKSVGELTELEAAAAHMEACRALLGVPDDEVLYEEIKRLKAFCAQVREALYERNAAYARREHGGIANHKLADEIERICREYQQAEQ